MSPIEGHSSGVHLSAPMKGSLNLVDFWPFQQVLVGAPFHGLPAQILQCAGGFEIENRTGRLCC